MCNIISCRNVYKGNVLLLLLSSLVTQKYLQCSINITTEQNFKYMKFIDVLDFQKCIIIIIRFLQIVSHISNI